MALAAIFSINANAKDNLLKKGTSLVNIGLGYNYYYMHHLTFPHVSGTYEYGIADFGKGGSIGVGGYLGLTGYKDGYYGSRMTEFIIGARGAYHYTIIDNKFDVYGGLVLGYAIYASRHSVSQSNKLAYDTFVGARYMFSENFGAFAEVGYGIVLTSIGVSLKF